MKHISSQSLIKQSSYIDGAWQSGDKYFNVENPATGEILTQVIDGNSETAVKAIDAASRAFKPWSEQTAHYRSKCLMSWFALINTHQTDLANLITLEQGKPLAEAEAEIDYGVSYVEWFAEEGKRVYGDTISATSPNQRMFVNKQAVGVVTAIAPWNFPHAMIVRKAAAALAAGCTFVVKPACQTPLSALALAQLADCAGIPKGVFNVVVSQNAQAIGKVLTEHPKVAKFSFTGSTGVGKALSAQCAKGIKRVSMELGGNAPFIVFSDADIDAAVKGAVASKFRNSGQTCISGNRFYIAQDVIELFTQKLIKQVEKLVMGNGSKQGVTIGPLINENAVHRLKKLQNDAINAGAKVIFSLKHSKNLNNNFYPPTILKNVATTMEIAQQELFGPILSLIPFDSEASVIKQANSCNHGLAAYFYTQDIARVWRVAESLQFGMVGINDTQISNAKAPFGGIKQSGNGREGSKYGLDDYLNVKYLCLGL